MYFSFQWPPTGLSCYAHHKKPRTHWPPRCWPPSPPESECLESISDSSFLFPSTFATVQDALAPEMALGEEPCGCESSHVVATSASSTSPPTSITRCHSSSFSSSSSLTNPHQRCAYHVSLSNTFTCIFISIFTQSLTGGLYVCCSLSRGLRENPKPKAKSQNKQKINTVHMVNCKIISHCYNFTLVFTLWQ